MRRRGTFGGILDIHEHGERLMFLVFYMIRLLYGIFKLSKSGRRYTDFLIKYTVLS